MALTTFDEEAICNIALAKLGVGDTISDITDTNDPVAVKCNRFYFIAQLETLEEHDWTFALKEDDLTEDATAPTNDARYANRFPLPSDFAHMVLFNNRQDPREYEIVGSFIHTNATEAKIYYVAESTGGFDNGLFVGVFATKLAYYLAGVLKPQRQGQLLQEYKVMLENAKVRDSMQNRKPRVLSDSDWYTAGYWARNG